MPKKTENSKQLLDQIVAGIQEVKGKEIISLDMRNLENSITDYFVICHGTSDRQVAAIAASVEKMVRENLNDKPFRVEGQQLAEWILIDYMNVIVHVFQEEKREFYDLERLWADAEVQTYETIE